MDSPIVSTRTVELRKRNRYPLGVPVFFFWEPKNGPARSSEGTTRDLSTAGIYVVGDEAPDVGELLELDILFPVTAFCGPEMHLTGEGIVLRNELGSGKRGVASRCGFAAAVRFRPELPELVLSRLKVCDPGNIRTFAQARYFR